MLWSPWVPSYELECSSGQGLLRYLSDAVMKCDKALAVLFKANFREAYRSAKLLRASKERIAVYMPLSGEKLGQLMVDDLDKLDAFRVRFCDLQDVLGNKVFRSLLLLEQEQVATQLDLINKMEKWEIIPSFELWSDLRHIGSLFSHGYPEDDRIRAEVLTPDCDLISLIEIFKQFSCVWA